MIYKIKLKGYMLVEADTPEEAIEKAEDDDYIEKCEELGTVKIAQQRITETIDELLEAEL